jgi:hypothetical protein
LRKLSAGEAIVRKKLYLFFALVISLFVFSILNSCAPRNVLRTAYIDQASVTGTYTLFLYGARYANDLETVAILAIEGTPYTFAINSPDFDYKVIKGISAKEAIIKAKRFVSFHHAFSYDRISAIFGPAGEIIGYEVRPYYRPMDYGYSDVMDIWYTLDGNKVMVNIHLKPEVEQLLQDGDRRRPLIFRR